MHTHEHGAVYMAAHLSADIVAFIIINIILAA